MAFKVDARTGLRMDITGDIRTFPSSTHPGTIFLRIGEDRWHLSLGEAKKLAVELQRGVQGAQYPEVVEDNPLRKFTVQEWDKWLSNMAYATRNYRCLFCEAHREYPDPCSVCKGKPKCSNIDNRGQVLDYAIERLEREGIFSRTIFHDWNPSPKPSWWGKPIKEAKTKTYKIGQRIKIGIDILKGMYILAQVDNQMVAAIDVRCGNRWRGPKKVKDVRAITVEEMENIAGCEVTVVEE